MKYLAALSLSLLGSVASASDKNIVGDVDVENERMVKASAIYKDDYGNEPVNEITKAINETSRRAIKKDFIIVSMNQEKNRPKSILSNSSPSAMQIIKKQVSGSKNWGKQLSIKTTTNVQGLYETLIFGGYSYNVLTDANNLRMN